MALPKPATKIDWTDGDAAKQVEPGAAKKLLGWIALERPPFEFLNFLFFNLDQWIKYLESVTDVTVGALQIVVDAGGSGNFLTLQAAHDAAEAVAGTKIIVVSDLLLDATVAWTKPDLELEMRNGKRLKKGGSAPAINFTGLDIQATADRTRLKHVAMGSSTGAEKFSGAGDVALNINVGADNVFADNLNFVAGNTTDLQDNGNTSLLTPNAVVGLPS